LLQCFWRSCWSPFLGSLVSTSLLCFAILLPQGHALHPEMKTRGCTWKRGPGSMTSFAPLHRLILSVLAVQKQRSKMATGAQCRLCEVCESGTLLRCWRHAWLR
jgi:hypothetical protein